MDNGNGVTVEVCQGNDCSGGGTALLEMEELIQEEQDLKGLQLCLVEGGCRDLCSVGPNVHIRQKHRGSLESLHNVSNGAKCKLVVESAIRWTVINTSKVDEEPRSSNIPVGSRQSIMARRADRIRWETLKVISRRLAKCRKDIDNNPDLLENVNKCERKIGSISSEFFNALDQPLNAEISAATTDIERDRANRRRVRLNRNIGNRLRMCFED